MARYFSIGPKPGGDSADTLAPLMLKVSSRSIADWCTSRITCAQSGGGSGGRQGRGLERFGRNYQTQAGLPLLLWGVADSPTGRERAGED